MGERFAGLGAPVRARVVTDVVAVLAFMLFGEALGAVQIAGLIVASAGVAITTRDRS